MPTSRRKRPEVVPVLYDQPRFDASLGASRNLSTGEFYSPGRYPRSVATTGFQDAAHAIFGTLDGWGHYIYGTKRVGRGKNAMVVPKSVPWKVIGAIGGVLLAGYILERITVGMANWWPGSSLKASSWSAVVSPVPFSNWLAQHLKISQISGDVSSLAAVPVAAVGSVAAVSPSS